MTTNHRISRSEIDAAIAKATIYELAEAIGDWTWLDPEHRLYFDCPVCMKGTGSYLSAPTARILDPVRWACISCGAAGTCYQLARLIREDNVRLERFLSQSAAGQVGPS
jgi:hypothetical protein